jgi:hypothetical protein
VPTSRLITVRAKVHLGLVLGTWLILIVDLGVTALPREIVPWAAVMLPLVVLWSAPLLPVSLMGSWLLDRAASWSREAATLAISPLTVSARAS